NPLALLAAATLLLVQLAWTYLPPLQQLFGSTALDAAAWGRLCLFAALLFLLVEAEKAWWHHRR
ncbi:MAG: cation transporting ATPase C-terminal domain-containing protein, partial [Moraxellaceae bacterium]|nr:cation transporting ATPase C-terminal domain-containing protein [Moraxellaceae bacterium]